tara:strand:+ start:30 stop:1643 length:1614 start_codon:yes stop_codon:yes gene_type:complete
MAQYGDPPSTIYQSSPFDPGASELNGNGNGVNRKLLTEIKDKKVSYNASVSEQILNISTEADTATTREEIPKTVEIENKGGTPLFILSGYKTYSSETAVADSSATRYLHTMIMPGETFSPPVRSVISTEAASTLFDGTTVSNQAPDSNEYVDSGIDTNDDGTPAAGIIGSASDTTVYMTPWVSTTENSVNMFRVGDLIRINNEIMEVTALGSGADADNDYLTVTRGVHGSDASASHADAADIRLPFFNAHHDYNRYSVAQTDLNGKFKCSNFFGLGRAKTGVQGILPGSVAFKFYQPGYQCLGLSGISSSTTTSLEAGGSYWFKIAIDGGTAESINFTVDSSNTNWGGSRGVVNKMQTAMDDKYNNKDSNTFNQRASVGIVNGDIRFTSGQGLSTSAIELTAGADGASAAYNLFAQQNGWIPILASINKAVPAKLPDDVVYDRITGIASPNSRAFGYDNGEGIIKGMCAGTIDYDTGALDIFACPVNSEFVYSVSHTSVFAGALNDATALRFNSLIEVLVNNPSQKWDGKVQVRQYK